MLSFHLLALYLLRIYSNTTLYILQHFLTFFFIFLSKYPLRCFVISILFVHFMCEQCKKCVSFYLFFYNPAHTKSKKQSVSFKKAFSRKESIMKTQGDKHLFSYKNMNGISHDNSSHYSYANMNGVSFNTDQHYSYADMNGVSYDDSIHYSYRNMNAQ